MTSKTDNLVPRSPIIVIMGHIDHGKSTLLDYIRNTNITETEAGGITQCLSAYEVAHKDKAGHVKNITFLDTPGHEAFQKMRFRGAEIADIAVLIISAEDGVKAQTLEALECIKKSGIPYIVALNKIDKPNVNVEKTKTELSRHGIYLERLGGDIPWVAISAKRGDGVPELLDLMLLVAELEELTGDPKKPAEGIVVEAHRDPKRGISATLIIKDGTIREGMCVASGESIAPVRMMEDSHGNRIKEAMFSSPVQITGFNVLPIVGSVFMTYASKKEAENVVDNITHTKTTPGTVSGKSNEETSKIIIPIVLKTNTAGSLDAIEHEIQKLSSEGAEIYIIERGVGSISEGDVKFALGGKGAFVVGFNTPVDRPARDLAGRSDIQIITFDIIYKLSEWLTEVIDKRKKSTEAQAATARASVLKTFSHTKTKQVVGGRIEEGSFAARDVIRIMRSDAEIGRGKILNLQQNKTNTKRAESGEFGAQIESPIEIMPGDMLETFTTEKK